MFIWDLDKIREILSKPLLFQKPSNPAGEVLAKGLVSYEGDKWAKHRRLINPAFQLDKIKVATLLLKMVLINTFLIVKLFDAENASIFLHELL